MSRPSKAKEKNPFLRILSSQKRKRGISCNDILQKFRQESEESKGKNIAGQQGNTRVSWTTKWRHGIVQSTARKDQNHDVQNIQNLLSFRTQSPARARKFCYCIRRESNEKPP